MGMARSPQLWRGVRVTGGDGDPFGIYRLRWAPLLFRLSALFFIGMGALMLWDSVRINLEVGLPWSDQLWRDVPLSAAAALGGPAFAWWLILRPRLIVALEGVVIINRYGSHCLPWPAIRGFDHVLGLVVETQSHSYTVDALEGASLRHVIRGRRDGVDDLAGRLNAHLLQTQDRDTAGQPSISVDTRQGRSYIRWSAVGVTGVSVVLGLLQWKLGL
jgi:hypothetical protein